MNETLFVVVVEVVAMTEVTAMAQKARSILKVSIAELAEVMVIVW